MKRPKLANHWKRVLDSMDATDEYLNDLTAEEIETFIEDFQNQCQKVYQRVNDLKFKFKSNDDRATFMDVVGNSLEDGQIVLPCPVVFMLRKYIAGVKQFEIDLQKANQGEEQEESSNARNSKIKEQCELTVDELLVNLLIRIKDKVIVEWSEEKEAFVFSCPGMKKNGKDKCSSVCKQNLSAVRVELSQALHKLDEANQIISHLNKELLIAQNGLVTKSQPAKDVKTCGIDEMKKNCDGIMDCPKGEDEVNCNECGSLMFECKNGQFIMESMRCDGKNDCKDFSDEANCERKNITRVDYCPPNLFKCNDGKALDYTKVCDKHEDCESDEGLACATACEGTKCNQICRKIPKEAIISLFIYNQEPNLAQIFERHQATLKKLTFHDFSLFNDPIPFRQLQLESMNVFYQKAGDMRIRDNFLYDFLAHQPFLKVLKMHEIMAVNHYELSARNLRMIGTRTELTELHLNFSRDISATDILEMRNLNKLEEIVIELADNFVYNRQTRQRERVEGISIENEAITQMLCGLNLPELKKFRLHSGDCTLSLNMFLDSFPKLRSMQLQYGDFSFNPGRVYSNMVKLTLHGYAVDVMPCFINSMPNLKEFNCESLFPRASTVRAIFKSKIIEMFIVLRMVEELSIQNEKEIKKLCEKIIKKCEEQKGGAFIEYRDINT